MNFSLVVPNDIKQQGPVVQSIISLTSSLVVKMLTVLVSNSQVFLLKKCKSYSHFFSKNISTHAIFMIKVLKLTNNNISFEQLGPVFQCE